MINAIGQQAGIVRGKGVALDVALGEEGADVRQALGQHLGYHLLEQSGEDANVSARVEVGAFINLTRSCQRYQKGEKKVI
ncbi:MAG: hypothetical protein Q8M07_06030 [Prosthecobacter sp.]|nr:hypothetical protein [Prosthecobacter sp.]